MLVLSTVGMLQLSHQARSAALTAEPPMQDQLNDAADTVMSAAALLLRFETGEVPIEVARAVNFITDHLQSVEV